MFRKMRRKNQELPKGDCMDILVNEPRGVLALLGDDDYPYTVPMSHVYVDGKLYFHGAMEGHKRDAIERNSKCSYCVLDKGFKTDWWYTFRSVIVFGRIKTLTDRDERIDKLTCLGDKFFPSHEDTEKEIDKLLDRTEVYELTIEHMSGKVVREK